MIDPFGPRIGGVPSADIAVPEHERETRFYARVLTTGEQPLWREDLLNNQGTPIIGLGAVSPEYAHLPLQWMPHIQVADVAASVERALALGGHELLHGKDDDGISQWAGLLDTNGAGFGIIAVVSEDEVPAADAGTEAFGYISWLDLTVADAAATRDFYCQVVGWTAQEVQMESAGERYADFDMIDADGYRAAGIRHARGANAALPPVWLICLPVGDLEDSVRRAEDEGGKLVSVTLADDGTPARAVLQDPVGAYLSLVQG